MGLALEKLPDWPAALTWEEALAYTRVGEEQMRKWVRDSAVCFRTRGPHKARIALRTQLDAALGALLAPGAAGASDDFDFG